MPVAELNTGDITELGEGGVEAGVVEAGEGAPNGQAAVGGDAAVAFLYCVEVIAVVTGWVVMRLGDLVALTLGLLQADDVRVLGGQPVEEALARRRADAVRVEGDDAHGRKV